MAYQNKVSNNEFFKKRHNMHRGKGKEKKKELIINLVRTSFDLNPKQDWVLAQQAQTMNL